MSKSHDNLRKYAGAIERAKNGDSAAEEFLRVMLKTTADTMPVSVLTIMSEAHVECQREYLRQQAEQN